MKILFYLFLCAFAISCTTEDVMACTESENFYSQYNPKLLNGNYRVYDSHPKENGSAKVIGLISQGKYVIVSATPKRKYIELKHLDAHCQEQSAWTFHKALRQKPASTNTEANIEEEVVASPSVPVETIVDNSQTTEPEEEVPGSVSQTPESINGEVPGAVEFTDDELSRLAEEVCFYENDSLKSENCLKVMAAISEQKLPKGPVLYALKALKELHSKMCDGRKLQNDCMVMVSDLDQTYKKDGTTYHYRHPAYFINLCVGDSTRTSLNDVYYQTFTNRGTGSKKDREKPNYLDFPGIKTTLTGLFITGVLSGFHPFITSRSKYAPIGYKPNDPNCKENGSSKNNWLKECPVLRFALHRIGGSLSGGSKPMHTSPFKSSSGCPSVTQTDNWLIRHMAARGHSLYIAYTRLEKYRSHFSLNDRCE